MIATIRAGAITPEEYLAVENCAETKSEYVSGTMRAMAGASPEHVAISFNLGVLVGTQVHGTACRGWNNDLRLWSDACDRYYYSDLSITCGSPQFEMRMGLRAMLNPTILFEVLSPATESIDRDEKWECYRQIESLAAYVIVAQDVPQVELFTRDESGEWSHSVVAGLDSEVQMPVAGCRLRLADIYENLELTGDPPRFTVVP